MIDFNNDDYDDNDIRVLTYRMNNLEGRYHFPNTTNNTLSLDTTACTSTSTTSSISRSSSSDEHDDDHHHHENRHFESNDDMSNFLQQNDDILRRMDARVRSKSKCVGEDRRTRSTLLIPCLGFQDCMMIQDD
jgi:hypothetical protein